VDEGGRGNRGERAGGSCLVWLEGVARTPVDRCRAWPTDLDRGEGSQWVGQAALRLACRLAGVQLQVAPCLVVPVVMHGRDRDHDRDREREVTDCTHCTAQHST